jgi:hypothetical protein
LVLNVLARPVTWIIAAAPGESGIGTSWFDGRSVTERRTSYGTAPTSAR